MNWEFHDGARAEFQESAAWYESRRLGLGDEFVEEVLETIERIRQNPMTWRRIRGDVRWCLTNRFPFAVVYRVKDGAIEVVAVMHSSRRPSYWKARVSD